MSKKYVSQALKRGSEYVQDIEMHRVSRYRESSCDNYIRCGFCLGRTGHTKAGRSNKMQLAYYRNLGSCL